MFKWQQMQHAPTKKALQHPEKPSRFRLCRAWLSGWHSHWPHLHWMEKESLSFLALEWCRRFGRSSKHPTHHNTKFEIWINHDQSMCHKPHPSANNQTLAHLQSVCPEHFSRLVAETLCPLCPFDPDPYPKTFPKECKLLAIRHPHRSSGRSSPQD